jgi:hypothetical protein
MNEHTTSSEPHMLTAACSLANCRLRIFPAHSIFPLLGGCDCKQRSACKTPGKHPHINAWPERATTDAKQIRSWWKKWPDANIAVAGGREIVIVDIDADRGGIATLARMDAEYGELPKLWAVKTGHAEGKNRHYYFSLPDGIELRNFDKWKPHGVEIKGAGGYVIAPPSIHESGQRYEWELREGPAPPLFLPRWVSICSRQDSGVAKPSKSAKKPSKPGLHTWFERPPDNLPAGQVTNVTSTGKADDTDNSDNTDNYSVVSGLSELSVSTGILSKIDEAVNMTFPRHKGVRNDQLQELGKWLIRIPEVRDKDAEWFKPVIRLWLARAEPFIGPRDFNESWEEWLYIWTIWLDPSLDNNPIIKAAEMMKTKPIPPIPAKGYRSETARRLVALCAMLSKIAADEDGVFYISCRDGARALLLDPEVYCKFVSSVFRQMIEDGILERVGEHVKGSMKAQRYRYHEYVPAVVEATAA